MEEEDTFEQGERVAIVAGAYETHQFGVYIGPSGTTKVYVHVDGDAMRQRRLSRTSIAKIP